MDKKCCAVCSKSCELKCSKCNQAHYCSKEHQKDHWAEHKKECFPFKVETVEGKGRVLIATKPFSSEEIICKEKPILTFPWVQQEDAIIGNTCVSCCEIMHIPNSCSNCGWPVCGKACEMNPEHSGNECKFFAAKKCQPGDNHSCLRLQVLRGLLLKKKDPKRYAILLEMNSHREKFLQDLGKALMLLRAVHMIKDDMGIQWASKDEIIHIGGVISTNILTQLTGSDVIRNPNFRHSAHLYERACLASHDCFANARIKIENSGTLTLMATRDIQVGEEVTIPYMSLTDGLVKRQENMAHYYFKCHCHRCLSPTELGSHLSSIKCPACPDGYVCPHFEPSRDEITWRCETCQQIKSAKDVNKILAPIQQQVNKMIHTSEYSMNTVTWFDSFLSKYERKVLHPNHYLIFEVLFDLIAWMHNMVCDHLDNAPKKHSTYLMKRIIQIGERLLGVLDIIAPGPRLIRGRILFFMATGLAEKSVLGMFVKMPIIPGTKSASPEKLKKASDSIEKYASVARAAIEILSFEPKGSEDEQFVGNLKNSMKLRSIVEDSVY